MYLSYLLIDTAADPAHRRPGRTWVLNPYRVHQRLWMAFPSELRKKRDEHYLDPFVPADFRLPERVERPEDRFLFRVDPVVGSTPSRHVVTVQSLLRPDWEYAFHNAPEYLRGVKLDESFDPTYAAGQELRFRLRANATKRLRAKSTHPDGRPVEKWHNPKGKGRRIGVYGEAEQRAWLDAQAARYGFKVIQARCDPDGLARSWKDDKDNPRKTHCITLASVRFEGTFEVLDPVAFRAAVFAGIGPGKGLGFGLLSVAPA